MTAPVTAIVVSYHTGPRLKECLWALLSDPAISEIRVVDNGNPDRMRGWLSSFADRHPKVRLMDAGGNIGFGAGVNLGAAGASEGCLLIVNPDAVLKRGSVEIMASAARPLASPWIIGGKIFDLSGDEARGPRRRELTLGRALTTFAGLNTWTLENTLPPPGPVAMDVVSGALMLVDTAGFDRLGGFDERYFLHVEDVDLCRRAREAGGSVVYAPQAGALHYGATSDAPAAAVARHKADSLAYYFRKFASGPIDRALVGVIVPLIRFAILRRARDHQG
jgi:GT2 family glycosyltransferase